MVYTLPEQTVSTRALIVFCKGGVFVINTSALDGGHAPFAMVQRKA